MGVPWGAADNCRCAQTPLALVYARGCLSEGHTKHNGALGSRD